MSDSSRERNPRLLAMKGYLAMPPKTQSVCKHCGFEIEFITETWIKVATDGVYCGKNPRAAQPHVYGRHEPVAEPASTGEQPQTGGWPCQSCGYGHETGTSCPPKKRAALPSEPSAPQIEPNILERVKKAFPEFAAPQASAEPSSNELLDRIHTGMTTIVDDKKFIAGLEAIDILRERLSDLASSPTPSVPTPQVCQTCHGDPNVHDMMCEGIPPYWMVTRFETLVRMVDRGTQDTSALEEYLELRKKLRELAAPSVAGTQPTSEERELLLAQFFPQGTPQVEEALKEFVSTYARLNGMREQLATAKYDRYVEGASDFAEALSRYFPHASQTHDYESCASVNCPQCSALTELAEEILRHTGGQPEAREFVAMLISKRAATPASAARTDGLLVMGNVYRCPACQMPLSGTPEGHLPGCIVRQTTETNLKNDGWISPYADPAAPGSVPQARYCKECWKEHLPAFCKDNPIRVSAEAEAFIKASLRNSDNEGLKQSEAKGERH